MFRKNFVLTVVRCIILLVAVFYIFEIIFYHKDSTVPRKNQSIKKEELKSKISEQSRHVTAICSQEERKQHILETCRKYQDRVKAASSSRFLLNPDRNVAFCVIPKNGCTTWKRLMAMSTNIGRNMTKSFYPHKKEILESRGLKDGVAIQGNSEYNNTKTFVILRHPMSRFLSAHYDKMFRNIEPPFTWADNFWIKQRKEIAKILRIDQDTKLPPSVSLNDFVSFVTNQNISHLMSNNEHWTRQNELCNLCAER